MSHVNHIDEVKANILSFMKIKIFIKIFLAVFCGAIIASIALPVACYAAVYYVATTGNDSNPGTQSQPWLTIQHAADTVKAGDTVIIEPGHYNERVKLPNGLSGTAQGKITFKSAVRRSAYMNGFKSDHNNYIRIEGLSITYTGGSWLGGGIWLTGNHWEIVDNYFYDTTVAAILPTWESGVSTDYAYIANNRFYGCGQGMVISGTGWVVENNDMEHLVYRGLVDADYIRFFGQDHIIQNNYLHGTLQSEIGTSHTDAFQSFNNNGATAKNIIIQNNRVEGFVAEVFMLEGGNGSHENITIRNNVFTNLPRWGICACGINNLNVYNNVFAYNRGTAIGFNGSKTDSNPTTGEIKNNIFYNVNATYWSTDNATLDASNNILFNTADFNVDFPYSPSPIHGNDILKNPMFVDPAPINGDFHLLPDSPAIDHGVTITSFSKDKDGNTRPAGAAWDIGAYEYTGSSSSNVPPSAPGNLKVVVQ